jgi:hypothetical protein
MLVSTNDPEDAGAPRRQPGRCARLVRYEPWRLPDTSLIGHCSIAFPGGWVVHGIPVFRHADGGLLVGVPDGRYAKVISFETPEARIRWNTTIIRALRVGGVR